jgi:hypothetical protein
MASLLDDMLKGDLLRGGNFVTGVAVAAAGLTLPIVFPGLRAPMLAVLKTGIGLFVEAEFEVEGVAIGKLVDATLEGIFGALSGSGPQEERHRTAHAAIRAFDRDARSRADRWGHNERDRARRYRRHVAALRRKMARLEEHGPEQHRTAIGDLADAIVEDW